MATLLAENLHYSPSPVTGLTLQFEDCRRCGIELPWDEELFCQSCRSDRPRHHGSRCANCGDELDCGCCEYCDGCSSHYCATCGDAYDPEDEGNDDYCGTCYSERFCDNCAEYLGTGVTQYDGECADCAQHCTACDEPNTPDDLTDGYCSSCRERLLCQGCGDRVDEPEDLILGHCPACRYDKENR